MEDFTCDGLWWLPETPAYRTPGTLSFDDDGLRLTLYGTLRDPGVPEPGVVIVGRRTRTPEPVIHGRSHEGEFFTVLGASGVSDGAPYDFVVGTLRLELALRSSLAHGDLFTEVWVRFDYLDAWVDPDEILLEEPRAAEGEHSIRVRLGNTTLAETDLPGAAVRLVTGIEGSAGGPSVHLRQRAFFVVAPDEPMAARALVEAYVRPLQDLLMFCVGAPVVMTNVRLRPAEQDDPRDGVATAYFATVQRRPAGELTTASVENFNQPTVLSRNNSPVSVETLIERWFENWTAWREVLELIHSPLYAPFMFAEHGFSSTFQSAEALHDLVLPTRDLEPAEHRRRVDRVVDALSASGLPTQDIEWATRVLQSRNDKPLWRKIADLLDSSGRVGSAVLAADPSFARSAVAMRVGVSHGGAGSPAEPAYRFWSTQVLRWSVRARILMELLGDADAAQERVAGRHGFRAAVERLAEARPDAIDGS